MPYQCFKTLSRDVYCSGFEVKSHAEGAQWIRACLAHFNIQANQLTGTPYLANSQPAGATIWP